MVRARITLALVGVTGCFSPEVSTSGGGSATDVSHGDASDPTGSADDAPACAELDEPCSANADCCDYEFTPQVGGAMCIDYQEEATCKSICVAHEDCESGCCGVLAGEASHGMCTDPPYCEAGGAFRLAGCDHGDAYECAGDDLRDCATEEITDCDVACVDSGFSGAADPPCGLGSAGTELCLCE